MIKYITMFFSDFWHLFCLMSPAMLLGFLIAGIIAAFLKVDFIKKHFGENRLWNIIKASLFGVPLPLCSCSVLPVGLALRKNGASRGSVTSFLISTPQTGVDSIIVTGSIIGIVFAVFKVISAFITGIIGGVLTYIFVKEKFEDQDKKDTATSCCHQSGKEAGNDCIAKQCTSNKSKSLTKMLYKKIKYALNYGFVILLRDIAKPFVFGVLLATLISMFINDNALDKYTSSSYGYALGMIFMLLIGVPMYVCSTASVPIAAKLMTIGFSPGAAFVFLMTGPATNVATLVTLWKIIGKKNTIIYLLTIMISSIGFGILLDLIYQNYVSFDWSSLHGEHVGMGQQFAGMGMLILLIATSFIPFVKKLYKKMFHKHQDDKATKGENSQSCDSDKSSGCSCS
ncbi:SO_0444 family Cu/Zn efflux transporter [Lentisphaerota bacterium WC36G]|nr:SO_0444 family Cu/Zn efflux transporter [Lentisphaerae bacterium WC36]